MKNSFLSAFSITSLLFFSLTIIPAHAFQSWHSSCSDINADTVAQDSYHIQSTNYALQSSNNHLVQLNANQFLIEQKKHALSNDQLQRIGNITSTGLLGIFLKHPMNECSKRYYTDSIVPIVSKLSSDNQLNFTWKNLVIKDTKTTYRISQLQISLANTHKQLHVTAQFSGLSNFSKIAQQNILLPQQGKIDFNSSAQSYSLILASSSGNNSGNGQNFQTIPIILNSLFLNNAYTTITGKGNINLDSSLNINAAKGKITLSNIEKLIANSDRTNIKNLKTALILSKFAGRSVGNNTLEWDIHWKDNLFKVNNIPLPIW